MSFDTVLIGKTVQIWVSETEEVYCVTSLKRYEFSIKTKNSISSK